MAITFLHRITHPVLLMETESVYFEVGSQSVIYLLQEIRVSMTLTITHYRVELIV